MEHKKKPLYRKENKVSLQTKYYVTTGSSHRHTRNTKKFKKDDSSKGKMSSGKYGYDYRPLFKFLLSKVGCKWDEVFAEAKSRLDKTDPIFWMVYPDPTGINPIVRLGEGCNYSALTVDENGILVKIDPDATMKSPDFTMHTVSFNGNPLPIKKY